MYIVAHYMAVSDFTHGHRGLSVQGVFESPQHEITTKYEFQISQSTKGKFYQSNELTSLLYCFTVIKIGKNIALIVSSYGLL